MKSKDDNVDMSPQAIARRLDDVRALYLLTMSLGQCKIIGPATEQPAKRGAR